MLGRYNSLLIASILVVSSIGSIHAQSSVDGSESTMSLESKIIKLDDLLVPSITATLTGLSLTGASFLAQSTKNIPQDKDAAFLSLARKSFIKAFSMFILCTIILLGFDFLAILSANYLVTQAILDVLVSYSLFGIGIVYLVNAAKALYVVYGK